MRPQLLQNARPKDESIQWRHSNNNKARRPHRLYFSQETSRGKEPADAMPGRMHATGFFCGYRLPTTYDLRVTQLKKMNFSPLVLRVKNVSPVFTRPPHTISPTKSVCVVQYSIISVCSYSNLYQLLARVQTMSMCPN